MLRVLSPTLLMITAAYLPCAVSSSVAGAGSSTAPAKEVPPATIAKLVADGGKTKPAWWDQTTLNYPQTLDLTWAPAKGGWNASTQVGVWMWDVINPNPKRWQEGTKFLHFVVSNAKQKKLPEAERNAILGLGHCYGDLLQDWPRAVYWYQQADAQYGKSDERTIDTANAYWRMGNKTLAQQTVKPLNQDTTRHGCLIKFHADLGNYQFAYQLGQAKASNNEDIGWFMCGYTAQLEGSWAKALDYFKKSAASNQNRSGRDWKQTTTRATAAVEAITLFEALDLKKVTDGVYRDVSTGYVGPIEVEVTVAAKKITSVKVTNHHEKQFYSAFVEIPAKVLAKQHVKGVDATLGATITSEAVVYASAKALKQGQR
ncbi:MAG: FMN-binding protein [Planctomycetota bacterium]